MPLLARRINLNFGHVFVLSLLITFSLVAFEARIIVLDSSLLTFFAAFSVVWTSVFVWNAIIYPKLLSPLRGLPSVPVR